MQEKEDFHKTKECYKNIIFLIALVLAFSLGAIAIFVITNSNLKKEMAQSPHFFLLT